MGVGLLAVSGIAASVVLLAYSVLELAFAEDRRVKRRLKGLTRYEEEQARSVEPLLEPFVERVVKPGIRWFADAARLVSPGDYRSRVKSRIVTAGTPGAMSVDRFMAAKTAAAAGTFLLLAFAGLVTTVSLPRLILLAFLLSPLAFYLPDLWLSRVTRARQLAIRKAMPDMLDMLTISVESGMGFDGAVSKLVTMSSGPLAEELGRMLQEVQSGIARRDALRHLADRVAVPEVNSFAMSLVQAEIFGISITHVLRTQAREMRVRRRQFAEEMAQKAPVKIVFPLVMCILPATLIVLGGPAVVKIGEAFGLL